MPSRRFVLLHSPLLGPMAWRAVTAELTRRGHTAEAPAWPRLSGVAANFHANLADHLVDKVAASGDPLILVAHSGAGALVPALAARLTTPLAYFEEAAPADAYAGPAAYLQLSGA